MVDKSWSNKYQNISYDYKEYDTSCIACCVAVSERYGLELMMMWANSVNTVKYHAFIRRLRAMHPFRRICLYMDNIGFHKSHATQEIYQQCRFEIVYNPAYSPFGNPIEECIA